MEHREILLLRDIEDPIRDDIAQVLNISLGTVKSASPALAPGCCNTCRTERKELP